MRSRFAWYAWLLRLYPKAYREKYADQMVQTLGDMLDDQPTRAGKMFVWLRIAWDLPVGIVSQNTLALGDSVSRETPGYVRQSGLLAMFLLLPFFAAVVANEMAVLLMGHTLYGSWLWSTPVLMAWVLVLPAIACAVAAAGFVRYVLPGRGRAASFLRRIGDIKRTWPVVVVGLCALGIICMLFFHDSVHCWVQNPVHFAAHIHETWQCTTQGFLGGKS
ncbi:MAG TPA: hypothetical protein VF261_01495 [Candidatus Saccharimonadales bacterium]